MGADSPRGTAKSGRALPQDDSRDSVPVPEAEPGFKCRVTGNPCGTDTQVKGLECCCSPCQRWIGYQAGAASRDRRIQELEYAVEAFDTLYRMIPTWQVKHELTTEWVERVEAAHVLAMFLRQKETQP